MEDLHVLAVREQCSAGRRESGFGYERVQRHTDPVAGNGQLRPGTTADHRGALLVECQVSHDHVSAGGGTSRTLAGKTVNQLGYYSGSWHTWATSKVSATGTYSFAIRATVPVNYYRAVVQSTSGSWIAPATLALHTHK